MTEELFKPLILSQLEDVLEEREGSDRRKQQMPIPEGLQEDRRKGDRRAAETE
jgi:hypothetical protein